MSFATKPELQLRRGSEPSFSVSGFQSTGEGHDGKNPPVITGYSAQVTLSRKDFPKLDAENYSIWSSMVKIALAGRGLDNFLTKAAGPDPESQRAQASTLAMLVSIIGFPEITKFQVTPDTLPHTLWKKIQDTYARTTTLSTHLLRAKFQSFSVKVDASGKPTESIVEFHARLQKLVYLLQSHKVNIDEQSIVCAILTAYRAIPAYKTQCTQIWTLYAQKDAIPLDFVIATLRDEEERISMEDTSADASFLTRKTQRRHSTSELPRQDQAKHHPQVAKFCKYHPDKTSHSTDECRNKPASKQVMMVDHKTSKQTKKPQGHQRTKQPPKKDKQATWFFGEEEDSDTPDCAWLLQEEEDEDSDEPFMPLKPDAKDSSAISPPPGWRLVVMDSASTSHVTDDISLFVNGLKPISNIIQSAIKGTTVSAEGIGDVPIIIRSIEGVELQVTLRDVLYVPRIQKTLIAMTSIKTSAFFVDPEGIRFNVKGHMIRATLRSKMWQLMVKPLSTKTMSQDVSVHLTQETSDELVWHSLMGHPSDKVLVSTSKCVQGMPALKNAPISATCATCIKAKLTRMPHSSHDNPYSKPLEMTQIDLAELPMSIEGFSYALVFVDCYSRYYTVVPARRKDDELMSRLISQYFLMQRAKITTENQAPLQKLQADMGFKGDRICTALQKHRIDYRFTLKAEHQSDGRVERANRTIATIARCLHVDSKLPDTLWSHSWRHAAWLHNRRTNSVTSKTPFELFYNNKPDLSKLHPFGCKAFVLDDDIPRREKTRPRALEGWFVGFPSMFDGYTIWLGSNKFVNTKDVKFDDRILFCHRLKGATTQVEEEGDDSLIFTDFEQPAAPSTSEEDPHSSLEPRRPIQPESDDTHDLIRSFTHATPDEETHETLPHLESPPTRLSDLKAFEKKDKVLPDPDFRASAPLVIPHQLRDHNTGGTSALPFTTDRSKRSSTASDTRASLNLQSQFERLRRERRHEAHLVQTAMFLSPDPNIAVSLYKDIYGELKGNDECFLLHALADATNDEVYFTEAPQSSDRTYHYHEVLKMKDLPEWISAMNAEMSSMTEKKVFQEVDVDTIPPTTKVLPLKWVLSRKSDGKYKARLVVQGHRQVEGIHYNPDQLYAPVVSMRSIRFFLGTVLKLSLDLFKADVSTAFLNSELRDPIFAAPTAGMGIATGRVLRLSKSLYGLHQAAQDWGIYTLSPFLTKIGFTNHIHDTCVWFKSNAEGVIIITVWVDDLLIGASSHKLAVSFFDNFNSQFKSKFLGEATSYVSLEFDYKKGVSMSLHQSPYIRSMLERFGLKDCHFKHIPITEEEVQSLLLEFPPGTPPAPKTSDSLLFQTREALGCLMWIANTSRPDICYAVNFIASFTQHTTSTNVWNAIVGVMRYLAGTVNLSLHYPFEGSIDHITVYTDASFADKPFRRATSGESVFCGGALIHWKSKRQRLATASTMESEFIALADCVRDFNFYRYSILMLDEIRLSYPSLKSELKHRKKGEYVNITVNIDNEAVISLLNKPYIPTSLSKFIDIRYHYVADRKREKMFVVQHVKTKENISDLFTKPLGRQLHRPLREKMMK